MLPSNFVRASQFFLFFGAAPRAVCMLSIRCGRHWGSSIKRFIGFSGFFGKTTRATQSSSINNYK